MNGADMFQMKASFQTSTKWIDYNRFGIHKCFHIQIVEHESLE